MQKQSVLLAGSTGYLGKYILKELLQRGINVTALARDPKKLQTSEFQSLIKHENQLNIIKCEVTKPETLKNICQNIDTVISTVGITRQQDGMTYKDVDYQANMNLLQQAQQAKIRKFMYVAAVNGDKLRHLKIMEAKEDFVDQLMTSQGIQRYTVVRPNGFFSDMQDFLEMAKGGTVYLFGDGNFKINPIHGADLAAEICNEIQKDESRVFEIGGPEIYTQNQIGKLGLEAWGKNQDNIVHVWDWVRSMCICMVRTFTGQKTYGPVEFFMTAMAMDNVSPCYGVHKLGDHFKKYVEELKKQEESQKEK